MGLIYFTSEFTDIKGEDWKVNLVRDQAGTDLNLSFNLGPDGFRLSYDYDEYDRAKPIIGSRVQITMYQNDSEVTASDTFYDLLSTEEEGSWRLEIYKDPDVTNTLFWAGEILAEQTIIPDEFPHAAISITAVDGLANLKGVKYNKSGVNLVQNPDFTDTGGELVTSWTNKDFASFTSSGSDITQMVSSAGGNNCYALATFTSGKSYKLEFTSSQQIIAQVRISPNTNLSAAQTALSNPILGFNEIYFTATANYSYVGFYAASEFTDTQISNFTLKELGADWTLGTNWSIGDGEAITDGTINANISQGSVTLIGKTYLYSFKVLNAGAGVISGRFRNGSTGSILNFSSEGTYTGTFVAYNTQADFTTLSDNVASFSITNIIVEEQGLAAYEGTETVLDHIHNLIEKLHVADVWNNTDIQLKFYEDFIGKEYKDSIGAAQNKQLQNAKVAHSAFYNKDEKGVPQFYSAYEVLETLALSFNACVFISQGFVWWVPLGAIQSHASAGLDIANYMLKDGTVTYNTVANTTIGAIFGSNSTQWEKLKGWERSSVPSFKEVKRTRDFFGDQPVVKDSNYTRAEIVAQTILDDEDVEYPAGRKFLVSGTLRYEYPGDNTAINGDKIARLKIGVRVRVGDAGGDDRYLLRATTYNAAQFSFATGYFIDPPDTDENDFIYLDANHIDAAWSASPSNYEIISGTFNKRTGTEGNQNGALFIAFSFLTPEITAATGLQISLEDFTGVDKDGVDDSDLIGATAQFSVADFQAHIYDESQSQEFGTVDVVATNPNTARYKFDQGRTLIGDRVTDADLGTIQIYNGSTYLDSTEWTNLQSSTASLSINGLGVRERLGANNDAKRIERGTLYKTGSTWIHPYTILTNTEDSGNFYQVSGLTFIAARSEYDIDCMFLSRTVTDIEIGLENAAGTPGGGLPDVLPGIKGPGPDIIVSDNTTKLGFITTDAYGITKVTTSTGGSGIDINLPITKASAGVNLISINTTGAMAPLADGTTGEFLKTNGSGVLSWSGVKITDDISAASAGNVGTIRYRTTARNSYVDICMQISATAYDWINIKENSW